MSLSSITLKSSLSEALLFESLLEGVELPFVELWLGELLVTYLPSGLMGTGSIDSRCDAQLEQLLFLLIVHCFSRAGLSIGLRDTGLGLGDTGLQTGASGMTKG